MKPLFGFAPTPLTLKKRDIFFPVGLPENREIASGGLAKVRKVRTVRRARSGERLSGGRGLYPGVPCRRLGVTQALNYRA